MYEQEKLYEIPPRIEYLTMIPPIPLEVIGDLEEVQKSMCGGLYMDNNDMHCSPDHPEATLVFAGTLSVQESVIEWLKEHVPFPFTRAFYIFVYPRNGIHKDIDPNADVFYPFGINYQITTGGPDARAALYDDDKNLIVETKIEPERWLKFPTIYNHDVPGISRENAPRILIRLVVDPNMKWTDFY